MPEEIGNYGSNGVTIASIPVGADNDGAVVVAVETVHFKGPSHCERRIFEVYIVPLESQDLAAANARVKHNENWNVQRRGSYGYQ